MDATPERRTDTDDLGARQSGHVGPREPIGPGSRLRWLGLVWLIGAVGSAALLILPGGFALLVGTAGRAITDLSQPDTVETGGLEGLMATGAALVVSGVFFTFGFAVLSIRAFSGRPYPRWRSIARFLVLAAGLSGATAIGTLWLTDPDRVPPALVGLEGVWYDGHWAHRFNANGTVDGWWSTIPHGRIGTWSRSGPTITVRGDTGWQFVGTPQGETITGTISLDSGEASPSPTTWTRKERP